MQTLDSSMALYSFRQAEHALKQANQWFNHLLDESIALNRAMLDFELKPMGVDDAVMLWFPLVAPGAPKATPDAITKSDKSSRQAPHRRVATSTTATPVATTIASPAAPKKAPAPKNKGAATADRVTAGSSEILINDLKMIAGIGPGLEKKLNAAGITSYAQIAMLTAADIRRLEREVVKFAGRITRDDWIGQAQQLLNP
jgi:predicted flap endonuclease-1-like 5' DNA nuclease